MTGSTADIFRVKEAVPAGTKAGSRRSELACPLAEVGTWRPAKAGVTTTSKQ
jgi:hypothetical protein